MSAVMWPVVTGIAVIAAAAVGRWGMAKARQLTAQHEEKREQEDAERAQKEAWRVSLTVAGIALTLLWLGSRDA